MPSIVCGIPQRRLDYRGRKDMPLKQFESGLDRANPRQAAFMTAVRRAGPKASYAPYQPGMVPWHSAMAATYAHATAPLRRLADRYVIEAAVLVANGQAVPEELGAIFQRLPASWPRPRRRLVKSIAPR